MLNISAATRVQNLRKEGKAAIEERIEDLKVSIEFTTFLIEGEVYYDDKFLRSRLLTMEAELLDLKNVLATEKAV